MEQYIIERGISAEKLKDRVNMRIGDGYAPCGGMDSDADYYYQTMMRVKQVNIEITSKKIDIMDLNMAKNNIRKGPIEVRGLDNIEKLNGIQNE